MEGLSAAERARIYKERAAAAGIGRAPNPEAGGAVARGFASSGLEVLSHGVGS